MVDAENGNVGYLGEVINKDLVDWWLSEGAGTVISQAELLPVLVAKQVGASRLRIRRAFLFVDNEATKAALINANSSNFYSKALLNVVAQQEMEHSSYSWYSRVPTKSNPADGPSRLEFKLMESIGAI